MNAGAGCGVRGGQYYDNPPQRWRWVAGWVALLLGLPMVHAFAPVHAQSPAPGDGEVRICSGGDVTLGTNLDTGWVARASSRYGVPVRALPDPDSLLVSLRPLVSDADIFLLNVEGAIGEGRAPRKCGPTSTACFAFRQPTAAAAALRRVSARGEVVGNVANNHAGDAGVEGLHLTVAHLQQAGVHVTGADTLATVVVTARWDTVAFLGFSTSGGPDPRDLPAVRRHVSRAAARYPRVVTTMHMGAEGVQAQRTRNQTEIFLGSIDRGNMVAFARTAVEAGAHLVVGHGPHVMRAVEWYRDGFILYSLGNLLTYGPFSFAEPMNRGAVACATLGVRGQVTDALLRPTRQQPPGFLTRDPDARAVALVDSLTRLDFPDTPVRVLADGRILLPQRRWPAPSIVTGAERPVLLSPR